MEKTNNEDLLTNLPLNSILLFDIDGTLTPSRRTILPNIIDVLKKLKSKYRLVVVGGSDISKIKEQLGDSIDLFEYVFSENGLVSFKGSELFHKKRINEYLGEENLQELINYLLFELSEIEIPKKRGTFIEYRTGMLNVSPIGRNCNQEERNEFAIYDKDNKVVEKLRSKTQEKFGETLGIICSKGGEISFDIVPKGFDKSYSLQFLDKTAKIVFFGDKIYEGGNDYEIAIDPRVDFYFNVKSPDDTFILLSKLI